MHGSLVITLVTPRVTGVSVWTVCCRYFCFFGGGLGVRAFPRCRLSQPPLVGLLLKYDQSFGFFSGPILGKVLCQASIIGQD